MLTHQENELQLGQSHWAKYSPQCALEHENRVSQLVNAHR